MSKEMTKTGAVVPATRVDRVDRAELSSDSPSRPDARAYALEFGKSWAYAPAPESADHVKIDARYELFLGGKWRAPRSGKYFSTTSPSTEEKLAEVAEASFEDVDDVGEGRAHGLRARLVQDEGAERAKYIFRIARARSQEKVAVSWPSSSRWTAASRSRSRVTWT